MTIAEDIDYGTPASPSQATVCLTIDGIPVSVPAGTSVMRAAAQAGVAVPKLCATDSLDAFGSCRLCVVDIEGRRGTPASCTTPCDEGMVVHTQTPHVATIRRGVMELYISDHPLDCLTCPANGDCELQDMAGVVGLREVRYGMDGENHLSAPKDESNPYFTFDASKCIACSRCVRACGEVQGTFALTIAGRGFGSKVSAGADEAFIDSECVSCGACVQACPTATLEEKSVIQIGMPTRTVKTTCAYCGVGCSFNAELRGNELVRMVPDKSGGANAGHSCVKGRFAWGYASHPDRVLTPLVRDAIADPWREASWDEAIAFAAERLRAVQAEHGVDAIGGITSSRCTNEEVYVVQKMIRAAFGNNNVDTCARVCHSPTGYGLKQTFGTSAGTQDFASVEDADLIVVIGANPTDAHPVFASRMKRRLRQGAGLIVIDPRRIDLVRSAHVSAAHHLQLLPGTNVAVVNAISHVIATEGLIDHDFVAERCDPASFAAWEEFIRLPENSPEHLADQTGVPADLAAGCGARLRRRPERRHLLRPGRHRAQPGLDDGDGHREPGDGHRQHRAPRRRRQPPARAEQRPGLLRHGIVPARAARLSARLRRHRAPPVRGRLGHRPARRSWPAHPQHARRGDVRFLPCAVHPGRGPRASPTRTPRT